jgi:hypothetical protein
MVALKQAFEFEHFRAQLPRQRICVFSHELIPVQSTEQELPEHSIVCPAHWEVEEQTILESVGDVVG